MSATWTFTTAGLVFRVYGSGDGTYWTMEEEGAEKTGAVVLRFEGVIAARTAIYIATAYRLGRDAAALSGVVREKKTAHDAYELGYTDWKAAERTALRQRLGLDEPD